MSIILLIDVEIFTSLLRGMPVRSARKTSLNFVTTGMESIEGDYGSTSLKWAKYAIKSYHTLFLARIYEKPLVGLGLYTSSHTNLSLPKIPRAIVLAWFWDNWVMSKIT